MTFITFLDLIKNSRKVCKFPFPFCNNNLRAVHTIEEESNPPLSIDPIEEALRKRHWTDLLKRSWKASVYSTSELSLNSFEGFKDQYVFKILFPLQSAYNYRELNAKCLCKKYRSFLHLRIASILQLFSRSLDMVFPLCKGAL